MPGAAPINEQSVSREFVAVAGRQVHFRRAGAGAPLLLLHQSPRSSAELVPLMRTLAPHFLVIAPDTPGYGLSEPLKPADAEPGIDDFADALAGLLDALGLQQAAVYGSHTGAIIAVRFAARYPGRVAALVANGIMLTTPAERADYAERYLPRFVPRWDGGHLAWMWSRLRDQLIFYPWFARTPAHRIDWPQTLDQIAAAAGDLLAAGDGYRGAYGAVLSYAIDQDLPHLKPPTLLLVAEPDALSRYVADYPPLPASVEVKVVPGFGDLAGATADWLQRQALPAVASAPPATVAAHGLTPEFVAIEGGAIHLLANRSGDGPPLIVLHPLGGSARGIADVLGGMAGARPVHAPDLPGNGDSDGFAAITPAQMAEVILRLADTLVLDRFDVVALGTSAALALALRDAWPDRVGRVVLAEPAMEPEAPPPDLTPDIAGAHLTRAWMYLRDRTLFRPWHDRSAAARIAAARPPRPLALHQALIDLLKAQGALADQLAAAGIPDSSGATVLAGDALPDERFQWGAVLLRALDREAFHH